MVKGSGLRINFTIPGPFGGTMTTKPQAMSSTSFFGAIYILLIQPYGGIFGAFSEISAVSW
jgi:hypothetical protein